MPDPASIYSAAVAILAALLGGAIGYQTVAPVAASTISSTSSTAPRPVARRHPRPPVT